MNTKFLKGLLAAAIGGAVNSGIDAISGHEFNWRHFLLAAGTGALIAVSGYLKEPPRDKEKEQE